MRTCGSFPFRIEPCVNCATWPPCMLTAPCRRCNDDTAHDTRRKHLARRKCTTHNTWCDVNFPPVHFEGGEDPLIALVVSLFKAYTGHLSTRHTCGLTTIKPPETSSGLRWGHEIVEGAEVDECEWDACGYRSQNIQSCFEKSNVRMYLPGWWLRKWDRHVFIKYKNSALHSTSPSCGDTGTAVCV